MNCFLAELWPSLRGMLEEDVVKGEVQHVLQENVTAALKFDRISLGSAPPKVLSLSMVPASTSERAITFAAEVEFSGKDAVDEKCSSLGRLHLSLFFLRCLASGCRPDLEPHSWQTGGTVGHGSLAFPAQKLLSDCLVKHGCADTLTAIKPMNCKHPVR